MIAETWLWLIFPLLFFGMMIFCMVFFRRRGRWTCCMPFTDRPSNDERIRQLEREVRRLKGER